jgi:hypothetical protein
MSGDSSLGIGIGLALKSYGRAFRGLLNQYPGAAVAYSLRKLSSAVSNVVRVRRSSDNAEQDFTAADVSNGTLVDWVNEIGVIRNRTGSARWTTVTPTATGFDAATINVGACGYDLYGSSGDSVTVTFDVLLNSGSFSVQLRNGFESGSSVSNSETISTSGSKSFTLTSSADFVALQFISASADIEVTNFFINTPWTNDGFVETWYDQSGNGNDATQSVAASQPKIVDAGSLVSGGFYFDGVDDYLSSDALGASMSGTDVPFSLFHVSQVDVVATQNVLGFGRSTSSRPLLTNVYAAGGGFGYQVRDDANILKADVAISSYSTGVDYLVSSQGSGTTIDFNVNGTNLVNDADIDVGAITFDRFTIGALERTSVASFLNGRVAEIIVYMSDQSASRVAIETNINDHYNIY